MSFQINKKNQRSIYSHKIPTKNHKISIHLNIDHAIIQNLNSFSTWTKKHSRINFHRSHSRPLCPIEQSHRNFGQKPFIVVVVVIMTVSWKRPTTFLEIQLFITFGSGSKVVVDGAWPPISYATTIGRMSTNQNRFFAPPALEITFYHPRPLIRGLIYHFGHIRRLNVPNLGYTGRQWFSMLVWFFLFFRKNI